MLLLRVFGCMKQFNIHYMLFCFRDVHGFSEHNFQFGREALYQETLVIGNKCHFWSRFESSDLYSKEYKINPWECFLVKDFLEHVEVGV